MEDKFWRVRCSQGPVIAVANHNGHELRSEVAALSALDEDSRIREEDPFTGQWAEVVPTSLVAERSRFEVDLNRPRETAVYMTPDDAWGLELWNNTLPQAVIDVSLSEYDAYYEALESLCREKQQQHGAFVVLDLHSYNYRRDGPSGAEADPAGNPDVNIGTGTMDRQRWGGLVDRFIEELRDFDFLGRHLDVRENVKFVGRQFPRWVHTMYPDTGCAIAVELKKFFMDEWTGELYSEQHRAIQDALASTLPGLMEELERYGAHH